MADVEDNGFTEAAFKALEGEPAANRADDDAAAVTPPAPVTPPVVDPPAVPTPPVVDPAKEDPKPGEETPPAVDPKPGEEPKPGETPPAPAPKEEEAEAPQPVTKDDVTGIINQLRQDERASVKELEAQTNEVIEAYYPEGLSKVLIDGETGKELRTPQDVVDASGGTMELDAAAKWLLNEQHKVNNQVEEIQESARKIAETTVNFKHDGVAVLQKYKPLFEGLKDKYPHLQDKVFTKLMEQVKVDKEKGVILSSPDVVQFYDDYLEPYKERFEEVTNQSATAAAPPPPTPPKPTADDRLDEHGDGGLSPVNDPNDFAQQTKKELDKGI